MLTPHVPLERVPGFEAGGAVAAAEGLLSGVAAQVLSIVTAVAELALAVAAEEASLFVVDHGVVLEAVQPSEGRLTYLTLVWLDTWTYNRDHQKGSEDTDTTQSISFYQFF